jgi:hypothetical protein
MVFPPSNIVSGGDPHNKGYYLTPLDLTTANPTSKDGDYAIVGATDSIWIWSTSGATWVDSSISGTVTSIDTPNGTPETGDVVITLAKLGAVPTTRTVNGQALSSNVTIDVPSALSDLTDDSTHRLVTDAEKASWSETQTIDAANIPTNTSNFTKNLSIADTDVQKALETLDELISSTSNNLGWFADYILHRINCCIPNSSVW